MLMPSVDRLEVAQALKVEVAGHILKERKKSVSLSSSTTSTESDIYLVELSASGNSILRIVDDSDRVGTFRENVTLAAYDIERSDTLDSKLVLLQVRERQRQRDREKETERERQIETERDGERETEIKTEIEICICIER